MQLKNRPMHCKDLYLANTPLTKHLKFIFVVILLILLARNYAGTQPLANRNINSQHISFAKYSDVKYEKYALLQLSNEAKLKTTYLVAAIIFWMMCLVIVLIFIQSKNRLELMTANRENYEQQMKLAMTALEHRNIEFDKLMRVVGHDLKSPMGAIGNMAEILLLDDERPEGDIELIEIIKNSSRDLIRIIDDLLEVGNINGSKGSGREIIDLEKLLTYTVALAKHKALEKNQVIHLSTIGTTYVKINREKIWRVINNLIVNAIKFSNCNSVIYVSMHDQTDHIQIKIKDEGIGIPDNLKEEIFDLFTPSKRHGTVGERSFGLGLHTSRRIIESQNGRIWFESREHEGSAFYLSLPLKTV